MLEKTPQYLFSKTHIAAIPITKLALLSTKTIGPHTPAPSPFYALNTIICLFFNYLSIYYIFTLNDPL